MQTIERTVVANPGVANPKQEQTDFKLDDLDVKYARLDKELEELKMDIDALDDVLDFDEKEWNLNVTLPSSFLSQTERTDSKG